MVVVFSFGCTLELLGSFKNNWRLGLVLVIFIWLVWVVVWVLGFLKFFGGFLRVVKDVNCLFSDIILGFRGFGFSSFF